MQIVDLKIQLIVKSFLSIPGYLIITESGKS